MPPGDTTIINRLNELPDTIRDLIDSLGGNGIPVPLDKEAPRFLLPESLMFILVLAVLAISAWFYIIKPAEKMRKLKIERSSLPGVVDEIVREHQYDQWLS